jgi:competence ComEA-like helix-hairpin-helix protein
MRLHCAGVRAAIFVACLVTASIATAQTMRVHFLDVGQGSSAILEFPCAAITSTLLNINTASAEDLNGLPMIGMKRARDIVEYRTQTGPFGSVDDLTNVPGIGAGTIKAIRPFIRTN